MKNIKIDSLNELPQATGMIPVQVFSGPSPLTLSIAKNTIEVVLQNIGDDVARARLRLTGAELLPEGSKPKFVRECIIGLVPKDGVMTIETSHRMDNLRLIVAPNLPKEEIEKLDAEISFKKHGEKEGVFKFHSTFSFKPFKSIDLDQFFPPNLEPCDVVQVTTKQPMPPNLRAAIIGDVTMEDDG